MFTKIYSLLMTKSIKNCSSEPVWRLVRTSNPGGVKAPGVRFALWSDFYYSRNEIIFVNDEDESDNSSPFQ